MLSSSDNWPASISFRIAIAVIGLETLPIRIMVVGSKGRPLAASAHPTAPAQFRVPALDIANEIPVSAKSVRAPRRVVWAAVGHSSKVSGAGCACAQIGTMAMRTTRARRSMADLCREIGRAGGVQSVALLKTNGNAAPRGSLRLQT